jgi:cytochrome c-type biogenesis protein CcmH/NrfG
MTDDELFHALARATLVTLVDERELDRRARHTARRIRREARREQVAGARRWWVALIAGIALLLAGVGAAVLPLGPLTLGGCL